jgi:transposase-like protein
MERYSKVFGSKWQSQYSEEFKRSVCRAYLDGTDSRTTIERKYKLGNSRLTAWLKSFGWEVKRPIYLSSYVMPPEKDQDIPAEDSISVKLLKKQLENALLEKELYRKMIEVAERDLKINIRKKSVTK